MNGCSVLESCHACVKGVKLMAQWCFHHLNKTRKLLQSPTDWPDCFGCLNTTNDPFPRLCYFAFFEAFPKISGDGRQAAFLVDGIWHFITNHSGIPELIIDVLFLKLGSLVNYFGSA